MRPSDEPASSGYLYGLTEGLELGGDEDLTRVTEHTVTIVNLTPEQSYHFMIFSADKSINVGTHTGQFTTTAPPPSTPIVVVDHE